MILIKPIKITIAIVNYSLFLERAAEKHGKKINILNSKLTGWGVAISFQNQLEVQSAHQAG